MLLAHNIRDEYCCNQKQRYDPLSDLSTNIGCETICQILVLYSGKLESVSEHDRVGIDRTKKSVKEILDLQLPSFMLLSPTKYSFSIIERVLDSEFSEDCGGLMVSLISSYVHPPMLCFSLAVLPAYDHDHDQAA